MLASSSSSPYFIHTIQKQKKKNRKYTGDYREQHGIEYGTKPKQFLNQCAVDLIANKERNEGKIITFFNPDVFLGSFLA